MRGVTEHYDMKSGEGTYPCVLTATTWNIWKWMSAIPKHAQEGTEGTNDRSHKERLKILNNQKSVQFRLIFCINQNDQSIFQNQTIHFIFRTHFYKNLQNGSYHRVGINKLGEFMKMMAFGAGDFFICYNIIKCLPFLSVFVYLFFLVMLRWKYLEIQQCCTEEKNSHIRW